MTTICDGVTGLGQCFSIMIHIASLMGWENTLCPLPFTINNTIIFENESTIKGIKKQVKVPNFSLQVQTSFA